MANRASGTVTFLFTDVEGSARRWEEHPEAMAQALAHHNALLRRAVQAHGGTVFKTVGDQFCCVFATALDALRAAVAAQQALHATSWGAVGPLRVRMALHSGAAQSQGDDYLGPAVNRVARLLAAGHGGQVLLSLASTELVRDELPAGVSLRDLGSHRLRDLQRPERIAQVVIAGLPADFPPLRTLGSRPNNLPAQPTPLVGREREVEALCRRLRQAGMRLVTLTGPGGVGKTRLALQVGAELLDHFTDGVFLVSLASIRDPALVPPTLAQALGVREVAGQSLLATLQHELRDRHLLLLLDNFEQVIGAAPLVADLLERCPRLQALVTSRAVLRLSGEYDFPVPPLTLPDPAHPPALERLTQYEAVRLFLERAQAARADFAVTNETAPAVAELCHRLEGLPLAIELAAARVRLFSPPALLARLERRLPLLTGGPRDRPARQQTMRAAIAWSYDLLDPAEQALFRRLAVFVGGWTIEAAEAVATAAGPLALDLLAGLESLLDKSLLRSTGADEATPRFGMLEVIREYGLEQLEAGSEAETTRRAHAAWHLALAERAAPALDGPDQVAWLARLEQEHHNLRAAFDWLLAEGDAEAALRLGGLIWRFWEIRGHFGEGRARLAQALAHPAASAPTPARAKALSAAGNLAYRQGDFQAARTLHQECLAIWRLAGDRAGAASALNNLGLISHRQGDFAAARAFHEQSLAIRRELGDERGLAVTLTSLANVLREQGDYGGARSLLDEGLAIKERLGDRQGVAITLNNLAILAARQGDYPRARALFEQSLAIRRELGDRWGIAAALENLGCVACEEGDYAAAQPLFEESLAIRQELGDRWGIGQSLSNLGAVACWHGDAEAARARYEHCLAIRREVGHQPGIAEALNALGTLAATQGDVPTARSLLAQALAIRRRLGDRLGIAESLEGWAALAAAQGQPERALRLAGAALGAREAIGAARPPGVQAMLERWLASARRALSDEAQAAALAAGQAMPPEQALAYAHNDEHGESDAG